MNDLLDELQRREYELKRHEFLYRLDESYYERYIKVSSSTLFGNVGALALFATLTKSETKQYLVQAFSSAKLIFVLGAVAGLIAFGGSWLMSVRTNWSLYEHIQRNFSDKEKQYEPSISLLILDVIIPKLTIVSVFGSGLLFILGVAILAFH